MSRNVHMELTDNLLTITVDLGQNFGESKSGKTIIVASTDGAEAIGNVKVNLNIYKSKK